MAQFDQERADEIFLEAIERPEPERASFISESCGGDGGLESAVLDMLRAHRGLSDRFLGGLGDSAGTEPGPESVAGCRIIREIGRGGMGVVYEAEQGSPRRRVAVKVVRPGSGSASLLRRFRFETEVLAQLEHPGIARIYEAGTDTIEGRETPYFVMEYVDGVPLDEHTETAGLVRREIVELVARVCDAVQHAHQRGVIHRDLKPANILVRGAVSGAGTSVTTRDGTGAGRTMADGIGQPKVLDFGVARLADSNTAGVTIQTQAGAVIGTLEYMSPEQVSGHSADLDTRSDVYALGVILYRLLAGRPPHATAGMTIAGAAALLQEEAPRLGTIDHTLRGDLETIAAKALEPGRERRYASAGQLADDLRRALRDEPISAHPPSAMYQVRKFARRNKALVSGAGATFLAVAGGLVASLVLLGRVAEERNEASLAQERAVRIAEFQAEMLSGIDFRALGDSIVQGVGTQLGNPTVSDAAATTERLNGLDLARLAIEEGVLASAVARLDAGAVDDPIAESELRSSIASVYVDLVMRREALAQYERAVSLIRDEHGADPRRILLLDLNRAYLHHNLEEMDAALTLFRRCGEDAQDIDDAEKIHFAARTGMLDVYLYRGSNDEARAALDELVDLTERAEARFRDDPDWRVDRRVAIEHRRAALAGNLGEFEASAESYMNIREMMREQAGGKDDMTSLMTMSNAVVTLINGGRYQKAEPISRELVGLRSALLGDDHEHTIFSRIYHGELLLRAGRVPEALRVLERARASADRVLPPDSFHWDQLTLHHAACLIALDRRDEASRLVDGFFERRRGAGLPVDDGVSEAVRRALAEAPVDTDRPGRVTDPVPGDDD